METRMRARMGSACRKYGLMLMLSVAAFACKDDDEPKKEEPGVSEVTLNGGRYTNVTAKTNTAATAAYSAQDDMTAITYTAMAGDKEFLIVIAFPGNDAGQKSWDGENCFASTMQILEDTDHSVMASYYAEGGTLHDGYVKIDKYGQVGGVVSGTFEGDVTFIDTECECVDTGTMKGTFRAQRIQ